MKAQMTGVSVDVGRNIAAAVPLTPTVPTETVAHPDEAVAAHQSQTAALQTFHMTAGKFRGLQAVSDEHGVIRAAAMDQRGSLRKDIARLKGVDVSAVTPAMLSEFKVSVSRALTPHASAILLDPEYGLDAVASRDPHAGVLLSYESTGYDQKSEGRLPLLIPGMTVQKLKEDGADCVKVLLYYSPDDKPEINNQKHAWVEKIGAECKTNDIPFFLEFVTYDEKGGGEDTLAFAKRKPGLVMRSMEEFSKPRYGVDVLKVEVPVNMAYTEGTKAFKGETAYTRDEAKRYFQEAEAKAGLPFIYLSAGVSDEVFRETLELATEAGCQYSGVLCGRATWLAGVKVYAGEGLKAFDAWMNDRGVRNINMLNEVLDRGAKPWYVRYGGLDHIQVD